MDKKTLLVVVSFIVIFLMLLSVPAGLLVAAEKYPSRSVELVLGFPPGGAADLVNRSIARHLGKAIGGTVVPTNKPGGIGAIATTYVANGPADGYTLLNTADNLITPILMGQATYKLEDVRIVCQFGIQGTVLAVPADSPWKSFDDFLDYTRKNPGKVTYGDNGGGTIPTIRLQNLIKYADLKMEGVPFRGDGEMIPALLGKHVQIGIMTPGGAKPLVNAGQLRVLFSFDPPGLLGLDPSIPDWPTLFGKGQQVDTGFSTYIGVARKTPDAIVSILEKGMQKITKDPEYIQELRANYAVPLFVDGITIEQKVFPAKIARMREILEDVGLIK